MGHDLNNWESTIFEDSCLKIYQIIALIIFPYIFQCWIFNSFCVYKQGFIFYLNWFRIRIQRVIKQGWNMPVKYNHALHLLEPEQCPHLSRLFSDCFILSIRYSCCAWSKTLTWTTVLGIHFYMYKITYITTACTWTMFTLKYVIIILFTLSIRLTRLPLSTSPLWTTVFVSFSEF